MNQNQWQKDYIGRRDPKVIREENANRVFEQRMRKIYQKPAPEPKTVNYIEQEIKERQNNILFLKSNPLNRKNKPF